MTEGGDQSCHCGGRSAGTQHDYDNAGTSGTPLSMPSPLFLLLSYMKLLSTSYDLMIYVKPQNKCDKWVGKFLYYDATIEFLGPQHRPYACLAIIVFLVGILLPLALLQQVPIELPGPAHLHAVFPGLLPRPHRRWERVQVLCSSLSYLQNCGLRVLRLDSKRSVFRGIHLLCQLVL